MLYTVNMSLLQYVQLTLEQWNPSITSYTVLWTFISASTNSANSWSCDILVVFWKNFVYKLTNAAQTHVVQGLAIYCISTV